MTRESNPQPFPSEGSTPLTTALPLTSSTGILLPEAKINRFYLLLCLMAYLPPAAITLSQQDQTDCRQPPPPTFIPPVSFVSVTVSDFSMTWAQLDRSKCIVAAVPWHLDPIGGGNTNNSSNKRTRTATQCLAANPCWGFNRRWLDVLRIGDHRSHLNPTAVRHACSALTN